MRFLKLSVLMASMLLCAVLLLGFVSLRAAPRGGGGGIATGSGDTNGDGTIDLSDAIYLLSWLFTGGPEPVACADSPALIAEIGALRSTIESLSQAVQDLKAVPCKDDPGRFVDNGNGTITDRCTGLMWLQRMADGNGNGQFETDADLLTWDGAKNLAEGLEFAGYSDWRLPTIRELENIFLPDRAPFYDSAFGLYPGGIWSQTAFNLYAEPHYWNMHLGPPVSAEGNHRGLRRWLLAVRGIEPRG